jgi:hypothetical protein
MFFPRVTIDWLYGPLFVYIDIVNIGNVACKVFTGFSFNGPNLVRFLQMMLK